MNYTNVKNPKWVDAEQSKIDCEVDFVDLLDEYVPYTASANDFAEHCRTIYQQLIDGVYGPIAPYELPPEKTETEKAFAVRTNRDSLLSNLDLVTSNPLRWASYSQAEKDQIAVYRQLLLDVPQQSGFPNSIDWPNFPLQQ
jgi:hypothetical protein